MVPVFISYAHTDLSWMKQIVDSLRSLERAGMMIIWCDRYDIQAGDYWENEIVHYLHTCRVAITLVSDDFCRSKFIKSKELRVLLGRTNQGLNIIAVRVSGTAVIPDLEKLQFVHDTSQALDTLSESEQQIVIQKLINAVLLACNLQYRLRGAPVRAVRDVSCYGADEGIALRLKRRKPHVIVGFCGVQDT
jgi:hypothetical protein